MKIKMDWPEFVARACNGISEQVGKSVKNPVFMISNAPYEPDSQVYMLPLYVELEVDDAL